MELPRVLLKSMLAPTVSFFAGTLLEDDLLKYYSPQARIHQLSFTGMQITLAPAQSKLQRCLNLSS